MPRATDAAVGLGAVVRRDASLFLSYRWRVLTRLLSIIFGLALFYYLARLVNVPPFETPQEYFGFAAVGLALLQILSAAVTSTPTLLREELLTGTFERTAVSGLGPRGGLIAMLAFPLVEALVASAVSLLLAVALFGLPLRGVVALAAIPLSVLSALSFLPLAIALLALVLVAKQASEGAPWLLRGMALAGGLYFPVSVLPGWLSWVADVQPFTTAVDLLRNVLIGTPLTGSAGVEVARLALFAVVLTPLSILLLDRAITSGQRRGTLAEY